MGHTQYTSLKWAVAVPGVAAKSYSGLVSGQAKLIKLIPLASGKVEKVYWGQASWVTSRAATRQAASSERAGRQWE